MDDTRPGLDRTGSDDEEHAPAADDARGTGRDPQVQDHLVEKEPSADDAPGPEPDPLVEDPDVAADDVQVVKADVPLPPGGGWPVHRLWAGSDRAGADGPTRAAGANTRGAASSRSFAPTADSPPAAPPSPRDRRGTGAHPSNDPGDPRPAAARTGAGPTARRALPRTVFHGLQVDGARERRPDQARPTPPLTSVEIDSLDETTAGAGRAVGLSVTPGHGPGSVGRPGPAAPGGPPPGSRRPGGAGRRRRSTRLFAALGVVVVAGMIGYATFSALGPDASTSLSQEDVAPAAPPGTQAPGGPDRPAPDEPGTQAPGESAPDESAPDESAEEAPTLVPPPPAYDEIQPGEAPTLGSDEEPEQDRLPARRPPAEELPAGSLGVGDCLTTEAFQERTAEAELVACDEPHGVQVVAELEVGTDSYPGSGVLRQQAVQRCESLAVTGLAAETVAGTALDVLAVTPTEESFDEGDRTILCVVAAGDEDDPLRGTLLEDGPG